MLFSSFHGVDYVFYVFFFTFVCHCCNHFIVSIVSLYLPAHERPITIRLPVLPCMSCSLCYCVIELFTWLTYRTAFWANKMMMMMMIIIMIIIYFPILLIADVFELRNNYIVSCLTSLCLIVFAEGKGLVMFNGSFSYTVSSWIEAPGFC